MAQSSRGERAAKEAKEVKEVKENTRNSEPEDRALPILPVRDTVLFPHAVLPLTVGRESSVQLINSLGEDKTIVVVAQREARVDTPQPTDLYTVGTLAVAVSYTHLCAAAPQLRNSWVESPRGQSPLAPA